MATSLFWLTTQNHACPRCNQPPGEHCRTPKGRKAATPHNARFRLLTPEELEMGKIK